ncbi:ATP-binding protein [Pelagibius sp.]|uniref:ATP-binding protein n=1 Tax=Pelagibius sp. TaxID=1931238 RepID=UPI003BAE3B38
MTEQPPENPTETTSSTVGSEATPHLGRLLLATLVLCIPVVLVFAVLVADGDISLRAAAIGAAVVVILMAVMLNQHFRRVRALTRYLIRLREAGDDSPLPPAPSGGDLLSPGLSDAIAETARQQRARRHDLRDTMAMNAAVLAGLPDPLILVGENRRVLRLNPAAGALLGQELAGRDLALGLRNPSLLAAVEAILEGGEQQAVEFTIPGKVERSIAARVLRLPMAASQEARLMIALYDLTGVKQSERMRADFVANVSHELRTPLSSLIGFIETLRGPAREDPEAQARFLKIMEEQSHRMSRLVDDLLSLSRIELQEHTPPEGNSDIAEILRSVASTLELEAARYGMRIEIAAEALPPVIGVSDELTQVFQNLLENAVKYGEEKTVIRVAARPLAKDGAGERRLGRAGVKVSVFNEGEGIEREHIPRLTERFYRVDSRRSRRLGGTGLGLAIVKHIINRHRGVLEIESRPDEGATFSVYLPSGGAPALALQRAEPKAS